MNHGRCMWTVHDLFMQNSYITISKLCILLKLYKNCVILFWDFYQFCRQRGVILRFFANPYLNTGEGKKLKSSQEKFIDFLICVERKIYADICRAFKNADTSEVKRYAGHIAVNTLAEVFSTEGIMKRTAT